MSASLDIDEIDDIVDMIQIIMSLNISCKGLTTLDEVKQKCKERLQLLEKNSSWTAKEALTVLTEAKKEDEEKRATLLSFYERTSACLDTMPENILAILKQNIGNFRGKIVSHKQILLKKEYLVLVAGDTGSGKSTLLNLILGEQLLPYSVPSTTSTIVEIRYGDTPKLVAHYKDKESGNTSKTVLLEKPFEASKRSHLQHWRFSLLYLNTNRERGLKYEKIELFWPHNLLKENIVLGDSPSVGESDIMDDIVTAYLPKASAFIYVINSANACGVSRYWLRKLIENIRQLSLDQQMESSLDFALFVCNKWDQVPPQKTDEVKSIIVTKLTQCWPSLDSESQIIYMSAKVACEAQKFGVVTDEFGELMNGIKSMMLKSIEARPQVQWRWLDYLLTSVAYHTKAFMRNFSEDRENVIERRKMITGPLHTIERLRDAVSKEMQTVFENKTDNAAFPVLTEAKKGDDNKRTTLLNFYERTDDCLNTLDGKALALLEQTIGNFKENIVYHKQNLKKKEFTVFVVGETSSGKSTLLNLILGEQLLPCSFLSTTSTICELRYGDTPILVAHLTDKESGFTVFLDELPEASEISEFVSVKESKYRERGSDLEKIELLWSHNLLKENVVLVDSPSSGESAIMDDMVKSYLPEAVAIIFVINVANAGGLRREMLENVIEYTRQVSLDTQRESFSKCALFVCNKWDQVPSEETDKVKNTIQRKLTECLPGLDLESQIIYMSAKDASKEEFTELMNGIESMVLKTIEARLQIQWR
ncbi:uncharacterized protein LOC111335797 [Stylophora pistillata]|uniref:uncharacterized protein LOC111335797 n=1 Tax=Stylophora pistillata TaxID=50429 RepID=UPI000C0453A8|nr:uncharacterized protein LOC111335797 [Stylophora pistillata]